MQQTSCIFCAMIACEFFKRHGNSQSKTSSLSPSTSLMQGMGKMQREWTGTPIVKYRFQVTHARNASKSEQANSTMGPCRQGQ
eukprot:2790632-Amphidinium_carterae.1